MIKSLSRLSAAMAVALSLWAPQAQAQSLPADIKFRAIQVDMSGYAAGGVGGFIGQNSYADSVRNSVLAHARQTFADHLTRDAQAPVLVIKVDSVMLTGQSGHFTSHHGGLLEDNARDFLQGSASVVKGGRVLATTSVMAAKDAVDLGGNEAQRLDQLSDFYVNWLRRQLGL